jgi:hypothetical protein
MTVVIFSWALLNVLMMVRGTAATLVHDMELCNVILEVKFELMKVIVCPTFDTMMEPEGRTRQTFAQLALYEPADEIVMVWAATGDEEVATMRRKTITTMTKLTFNIGVVRLDGQ